MKRNGRYSLDKVERSGEGAYLMSKVSVWVSSENEDGRVVGKGRVEVRCIS